MQFIVYIYFKKAFLLNWFEFYAFKIFLQVSNFKEDGWGGGF